MAGVKICAESIRRQHAPPLLCLPVEENRGRIRADKLQQLHALHNLWELLGPEGRGVPGVAPTLRDSQLRQHADAIR